ncbi:MAG: oxidoreductase [Clostridia bacterium]|nr:oxidoreductase [Clostridia bacterium]
MINFGTIGTSWITEEFITTGKTFGEFNLAAVYSRDEEKGRVFAEKHGAKKIYTDMKEMAESDIDAVYIASPNSMHCSQSMFFMNHKKHVICEKPLASNCKELDEMFRCAKDNNVLLMEAYKSALMPGFKAIREQLPKVGALRSIYINFSKYSSRYDAHKAGKKVNTFKAEFSNGAMMDLGVYALYPIISLFGSPKEVKAFSTIIPDGVDGAGTTIMNYDTFTVTLNYSKVGNSFLPSEIQGEDATICIDKFNIPEKVEVRYRDGRREEINILQRQDSMCYEIEEFIHCIKEGLKQSQVNSHKLSYESMSIMDEVRRQTGVIYPADIN